MLEDIIEITALFFLGACIGSFVNVVALRSLTKEDIVKKPSHCPQCQHKLAWYELIPVLSFTLLAGRCRYCRAPISAQYPIVELLVGVIAIALFYPALASGHIVPAILEFMAACVLVILAIIDAKTFLLPDSFIIILSVIAVVLTAFLGHWPNRIIGALIGSGFLLFIYAVTRGQGIGLGDVKLMLPVGLILGWPGAVMMLLYAFLVGGGWGILLLVTHRATPKTAIPFGPLLVGSTILMLLVPSLPALTLRLLGWPI